MALDTTVGGASANSYASLAEYKAYWGARLYNTAALAADDPTITQALEWSCLLLGSLIKWTGAAVDAVQALAWPRRGMVSANGFPIASNVLPQSLKNAQCEYAGLLISLGVDRTLDNPDLKVVGGESKVTSIKAGSVSLGFGDGGVMGSLQNFDAFIRSLGPDFGYISKSMPDSVRQMIPASWYVQGQLKRAIRFGAL